MRQKKGRETDRQREGGRGRERERQAHRERETKKDTKTGGGGGEKDTKQKITYAGAEIYEGGGREGRGRGSVKGRWGATVRGK